MRITLVADVEKTPFINLVEFSLSNGERKSNLFYNLSEDKISLSFSSEIRITWWTSEDILNIKENKNFKPFHSKLFEMQPIVCWYQSRLTDTDTFNLVDLKYLPQLINEVKEYIIEYVNFNNKSISLEIETNIFEAEIDKERNMLKSEFAGNIYLDKIYQLAEYFISE